MEREPELGVNLAWEGATVLSFGVLTECSMCNARKKSRRNHKVRISDNLWDWSDWGNEFNEKFQEESADDKLRVLPEELVEKILAMVPFPYVFKARILSKSWLARLSPISSQDDVEKKRLAILFQKQIRQWSSNWKVLCPVHDFSDDDLLAYDRSSHCWQRLPSLSFLHKGLGYGPIPFSQMKSDQGGFIVMGGALLLWVVEEELYVANILTQEWKQLPPLPYKGLYRLSLGEVVLSHTLETYKVILLSWPPLSIQDQFPDCEDFLQIYDSATASWSHVMVASYIDIKCFDAVDGVFYFVNYDLSPEESTTLKVMSLNIKEESMLKESVTVAEVDLKGKQMLEAYPVICNTNLLIIIVYLDNGPPLVVKVDPGRKQLLGVSDQGPPDYPKMVEMHPVSDGDYIFAKVEMDGSGVLAYNVHADQSELLPYCMDSDHQKMWEGWREIDSFRPKYWQSFRPGLNPFAAV